MNLNIFARPENTWHAVPSSTILRHDSVHGALWSGRCRKWVAVKSRIACQFGVGGYDFG